MTDTLDDLRKKIENARELSSVVRTMKAMAASSIAQFEMAIAALADYNRTISLGISAAWLKQQIVKSSGNSTDNKNKKTIALVFGSDMGLVGRFNEQLASVVSAFVKENGNEIEIWAVGERMQALLAEAGCNVTKLFLVPGSVNSITLLVGKILMEYESCINKKNSNDFFVFHNAPKKRYGYEQIQQRLLPVDDSLLNEMSRIAWPTEKRPELIGETRELLAALLQEFIFVTLFKSCAESIASENSARLEAMQRADKNIDELRDNLNYEFNKLRQDSIDEELFDIIAGFEAMKKKRER